MTFNTFGDKANPVLLLVPGLGVSYGIFLPLIHILEDRFRIVAAGIDGFLLGKESSFTSVDDQAGQIIRYVQDIAGGHLDVAYGLSLGGKILSRIMERGEIVIDHAIMDAAPLLPEPEAVRAAFGSSTIVFHSPQAGHRPIHFALSFPHEVQYQTVLIFVAIRQTYEKIVIFEN